MKALTAKRDEIFGLRMQLRAKAERVQKVEEKIESLQEKYCAKNPAACQH